MIKTTLAEEIYTFKKENENFWRVKKTGTVSSPNFPRYCTIFHVQFLLQTQSFRTLVFAAVWLKLKAKKKLLD